MVKRLRLNDKTVREQVPQEGRHYQIFDTEVRGFSIRILQSGGRSFALDLPGPSAAWPLGVGPNGQ
jgi:hypothetical protein